MEQSTRKLKLSKLKCYDKGLYEVVKKRPYNPSGKILREDQEKCFAFAYDMAFGEGRHRRNRSGGTKRRKNGEIFINTFQGKLAEYGVYRYFKSNEIKVSKPDLTVQGYGFWDSYDIEVLGKHIAIKSTKEYGNLLLLEVDDWNKKGEYIPNKDYGIKRYDYFVLIRIAPDGVREMKKEKYLYSNDVSEDSLRKIIMSKDWSYDLCGYITGEDFLDIIKEDNIIQKNACIYNHRNNTRIPLDATNYYIQSGDMRIGEELVYEFISTKQMFGKT